VFKLVGFANEVTNELFMGLMIIAFFIITLVGLKSVADTDDALLVSLFIYFILSLVLGYAGLLNFTYVLAFGIGLVFAGLYAYITRKK